MIVSLAVSHHPPVQYSRTLSIPFGRKHALRVCAPCTGEALGAAITVVFILYHLPPSVWATAGLASILPLAAIIDWSTQAHGKRESCNLLRIVTGAMFSAGCVLSLRLLLSDAWAMGVASLLVIGMEGWIALSILRHAGVVDAVLLPFLEYAAALQNESSSPRETSEGSPVSTMD